MEKVLVQEWMWDKASVFWVRSSMYLVFKCSLTCRLSSCMWARVAAAVHIVTNCPYVFFNRCALETWGVMLRVTSSPGLSLLTWMSELCLQSCSDAYTHTDLLNWLRTWNHLFFIREGSKCRFPYISGNLFLNYYLFTHTYLLLLNLWDMYHVLCVTFWCDSCSMSWMLVTRPHSYEDIAHMCSQLHLLWIAFLDISDANSSLNMSKNAYVSRIYVGFRGENTLNHNHMESANLFLI